MHRNTDTISSQRATKSSEPDSLPRSRPTEYRKQAQKEKDRETATQLSPSTIVQSSTDEEKYRKILNLTESVPQIRNPNLADDGLEIGDATEAAEDR